MNGTTETRVRMGAKQTAKGSVQLDITAEAPTVDKAGDLMRDAIVRLRYEINDADLELVSDVAK